VPEDSPGGHQSPTCQLSNAQETLISVVDLHKALTIYIAGDGLTTTETLSVSLTELAFEPTGQRRIRG
jgi:hypothetical protein